MIKIKRLALLMVFMGAASAFAQETPLLKIFRNINTLEANFVQENYYPGVDSYAYKGKVYIERGYRALWDYEDPDEYYLLESGSIMHYSAELKQAVKMYVDMSRFEEPSAVLLGLMLSVRSVTDTFDITENGNTLVLTPKHDLGLENIEMDMKDGKLSAIRSADSAGNRINITFTNVKQNEDLNRRVFVKVLPEGTDFIEQ